VRRKSPIKYLATNKINVPSAHIIQIFKMMPIDGFFRTRNGVSDLGCCGVQDADSAS